MIDHAIAGNLMAGQKWKYKDPTTSRRPITWTATSRAREMAHLNLFWYATVALDEGIIGPSCEKQIQWLRKQRNKVHVQGGSLGSYLGTSMKAYRAVGATINDTKRWRRSHP